MTQFNLNEAQVAMTGKQIILAILRSFLEVAMDMPSKLLVDAVIMAMLSIFMWPLAVFALGLDVTFVQVWAVLLIYEVVVRR